MVICCAAVNCSNRQGKGEKRAVSFHRYAARRLPPRPRSGQAGGETEAAQRAGAGAWGLPDLSAKGSWAAGAGAV